ncbi:MAG: hypothetical protein AB1499_05870 [Nitrospirota bacterium]
MIDTVTRTRSYRSRIYAIVFFYLVILSAFGCSTNGMKQFIRPDYDIGSMKTVAVIPFRNFTADNFANEKIRSKVSIELLSRDINIIEPGEIISVMRELKIRSVDSMRNKDFVSMGNMLNVDAVITGAVETFGISKGITTSYPEVSVQLMMFETATGNIVWSTFQTSGGASFWTRHFGAEGSTLDNVSEMVVKEAFDSLFGR